MARETDKKYFTNKKDWRVQLNLSEWRQRTVELKGKSKTAEQIGESKQIKDMQKCFAGINCILLQYTTLRLHFQLDLANGSWV